MESGERKPSAHLQGKAKNKRKRANIEQEQQQRKENKTMGHKASWTNASAAFLSRSSLTGHTLSFIHSFNSIRKLSPFFFWPNIMIAVFCARFFSLSSSLNNVYIYRERERNKEAGAKKREREKKADRSMATMQYTERTHLDIQSPPAFRRQSPCRHRRCRPSQPAAAYEQRKKKPVHAFVGPLLGWRNFVYWSMKKSELKLSHDGWSKGWSPVWLRQQQQQNKNSSPSGHDRPNGRWRVNRIALYPSPRTRPHQKPK